MASCQVRPNHVQGSIFLGIWPLDRERREAAETIFYSLSEVGGIRDIGSSRILPYTREGRRVNQGQARRHLVIEVLLESTPAFRADADTSRSVAQVGRVSQ